MVSSIKETLLQKIKSFPQKPGVYLMHDKSGRVIYVGKAKNLLRRVRQYFGAHDSRFHIEFLMRRVADIDFMVTANEDEALLFENTLIKKHKPRYNFYLKDDKTYQGLKVTVTHEFPQLLSTRRVKKDGALYFGPFTSSEAQYRVRDFIDRYFQLRTCSDRELTNRIRPCLEYQLKRCSAPCVKLVSKAQYATQISEVLLFLKGQSKALQKIVKDKMLSAGSLENFEEAARLRDILTHMESLFAGQGVTQLSFAFVDVIAVMRKESKAGVCVLMVREARLIDSKFFTFDAFEDDDEFIQNFILQYYTENSFIPGEIIVSVAPAQKKALEDILKERLGFAVKIHCPSRGKKHAMLDLARQNLEGHFLSAQKQADDSGDVLNNIKTRLNLSRLPERMECYDISNISGQTAVGSMVTFWRGAPCKEAYRRFKIKGVQGPDDFAMIREVLFRRFNKQGEGWEWPDLLVVDGGKGQLAQVLSVFKELGITGIDCIGLAKERANERTHDGTSARAHETSTGVRDKIFLPGQKNPVMLHPKTQELMMLQRLRDEAHRFALRFHQSLRDQKMSESFLDLIPHIGTKRKRALIARFGSPQGVANASFEDLLGVTGVTREIAEAIRKHSQQYPL